MIGSSYAFTGATGPSLATANAAGNLSSVNKYEMYKNSGRQNSQAAAVQKPPRAMQHRLNNFFQYGQQQRKSNSKLAGVPGQAPYQPQNPPLMGSAGATHGGGDPRSGAGATSAAPDGAHAPGQSASAASGQTAQGNTAQGQ